MAHVAELHLAHTPPSTTVYAALFTNVRNAAFLRQQLLAGNTAFEYALIDASLLLSTTHALAAVFRAVTDLAAAHLRSRNVHAEIVFSLSATNNIAESFRRFGVADGTQALLAVKVGTETAPATLEAVSAHLLEHVQGTLVPFCDDEIARLSDLAAIRKAYKLNAGAGAAAAGRKLAKGAKGPVVNGHGEDGSRHADATELQERREIEVAALGLMALKGS